MHFCYCVWCLMAWKWKLNSLCYLKDAAEAVAVRLHFEHAGSEVE